MAPRPGVLSPCLAAVVSRTERLQVVPLKRQIRPLDSRGDVIDLLCYCDAFVCLALNAQRILGQETSPQLSPSPTARERVLGLAGVSWWCGPLAVLLTPRRADQCGTAGRVASVQWSVAHWSHSFRNLANVFSSRSSRNRMASSTTAKSIGPGPAHAVLNS